MLGIPTIKAVNCTTNLVRVNPHWYTKGSSQTEVGQFYHSLAVYEKVLWFQISVKHSPLVTEQDPLNYLVGVTLEKLTRAKYMKMQGIMASQYSGPSDLRQPIQLAKYGLKLKAVLK